MNKYSVNLSTVFTEVPFLERFRKAAEAGFTFIECQFPYAYTIEEIRKELEQNRLSMELLNLPPGYWEKGDRGIAAIPNRIEEFKRTVAEGIRFADGLGVKKIHCMAGIVSESDREKAEKVYKENLFFAGSETQKAGITLLIEPINTYDMPGYFLNDIRQTAEILNEVDLPNVKLQFDFYHIERIHGNPLSLYQKYADLVAHVQIADHPGRHEPGTGEMHYKEILRYLAETNRSMIGLEYNPKNRSEDSLDWLENWGQ